MPDDTSGIGLERYISHEGNPEREAEKEPRMSKCGLQDATSFDMKYTWHR